MTPFPHRAFINEEAIGYINEKAVGAVNEAAIYAINEAGIGAIIAPRNPPFFYFICCFISYFTVSVALSINRPDFFNDSTILIIS